jgi:hypothetical protein
MHTIISLEIPGNFSLTPASRPALVPSQPRIQWVLGVLSLGYSGRVVKLTTHLHLLPTSKMREAVPPLPNTPSWRGAQKRKQRGNFNMKRRDHL